MWHWLLTSTTYGTWLPGDPRGSVTSVRDYRRTDTATNKRIEHDRYGDAWEPPVAGLHRAAKSRLKSEPVLLTGEHAQTLLTQFQESAEFRRWRLLAASVMANHFHVVLAFSRDTDSAKAMQTLKAYGSRALNERFGKPTSGTWWTKSGSRRLLPDENAIANAIRYVTEKQPNPLVIWKREPRRD